MRKVLAKTVVLLVSSIPSSVWAFADEGRTAGTKAGMDSAPLHMDLLGWIALILAIALLFFGIWNTVLRSRVQEKTAALEDLVDKLKKSEGEYRDTLLNLPVGIGLYTQPERPFLYNEAFLNLFKTQEGKVKGTHAGYYLVDAEGQRLSLAEYPPNWVFATGREIHNRTVGICLEGKGINTWVKVDAFPQWNDQKEVYQVVVMLVDISAHKLAEQALLESEEKFYKAFRHSADIIGIASFKDGRYVEVNDTFLETFGFGPEEVIGRTSLEFGLWADEKQREDLIFLLHAARKARNREVVWQKKSGEHRTGLYSGEVINIAGQDYILFVWHDITERKLAEEHLRQVNSELERKVELRTQDLLAMNEELQAINQELTTTIDTLRTTQHQLIQSEKLASLGSLVAGVAHEINTPVGIGVTASSHLLHAVRDFSQQFASGTPLRRKELEAFLVECNEASTIIFNNLERASRLIRSFKQVSADQHSEAKRVFRIKPYLEEILLSLQPKLKKTNHKVRIQCDEHLEMDGYPGAFSQVITNLVVNSLLHAYGEEDQGCIAIQVELKDKQFYLRYSDDGKGIDAKVANRIFDPFFTTKRGDGGTGLGLYVVYNIVTQQFGGTIECVSNQGRGTTFTICFPQRKEL